MRFTLYLITLSFSLMSCGGGGTSRPGPLDLHFDEAHIATVDMTAKQKVLDTQNDYHIAKAAFNKADADYNESKALVSVAKNEQKQSILEAESAETKHEAAKLSSDMNRINQAAKLVHTATLGRRAADEKVTALNAHQSYLDKQRVYREEEMYHREALFELAKADLAKANNIQPKEFSHSGYKLQADSRASRVKKALDASNQAKSKADSAKKAWQARKQEADKARG